MHTLAADLTKRGARGTTTIVADLGNPHGAAEVTQQLGEARTAVDVLVNSAGRGVYGPFLETTLDDELEMLQLNMVSLTALTKLVVPAKVARRTGRIVNLASTAAFVPGPLIKGQKLFEADEVAKIGYNGMMLGSARRSRRIDDGWQREEDVTDNAGPDSRKPHCRRFASGGRGSHIHRTLHGVSKGEGGDGST